MNHMHKLICFVLSRNGGQTNNITEFAFCAPSKRFVCNPRHLRKIVETVVVMVVLGVQGLLS